MATTKDGYQLVLKDISQRVYENDKVYVDLSCTRYDHKSYVMVFNIYNHDGELCSAFRSLGEAMEHLLPTIMITIEAPAGTGKFYQARKIANEYIEAGVTVAMVNSNESDPLIEVNLGKSHRIAVVITTKDRFVHEYIR